MGHSGVVFVLADQPVASFLASQQTDEWFQLRLLVGLRTIKFLSSRTSVVEARRKLLTGYCWRSDHPNFRTRWEYFTFFKWKSRRDSHSVRFVPNKSSWFKTFKIIVRYLTGLGMKPTVVSTRQQIHLSVVWNIYSRNTPDVTFIGWFSI